MSPAAQALLPHVPDDRQANCQETPTSAVDAGALVAVACGHDEPGASIAEYVQFDGAASMNTAYQQRVGNFGVDSQWSCQTSRPAIRTRMPTGSRRVRTDRSPTR
jgi:hypothetical protein